MTDFYTMSWLAWPRPLLFLYSSICQPPRLWGQQNLCILISNILHLCFLNIRFNPVRVGASSKSITVLTIPFSSYYLIFSLQFDFTALCIVRLLIKIRLLLIRYDMYNLRSKKSEIVGGCFVFKSEDIWEINGRAVGRSEKQGGQVKSVNL